MKLEKCTLCDGLTGGAGKLDDSLYVAIHNDNDDSFLELGPLCPNCYEQLNTQPLFDEILELKIALKKIFEIASDVKL